MSPNPKKRKTGPESFREKAKRPTGAGLVTRREFRQNEQFSEHTMNAVRTGYNTMWRCAGPYMTRKNLRRPGEFRHDNQHGGKLWATRKECQMTDRIAGEIFEKCYDSKKIGVDQLKQVRHSLSYSYYLAKGIVEDNWPEVKAQWKSFNLTACRRPKDL